jgi:hypothetical protein
MVPHRLFLYRYAAAGLLQVTSARLKADDKVLTSRRRANDFFAERSRGWEEKWGRCAL